MEYTIDLTDSPKDKLVLGILRELKVKIKKPSRVKKALTAKDVALGIDRKATKAELAEYAERAEKSESIDMGELMEAYGK